MTWKEIPPPQKCNGFRVAVAPEIVTDCHFPGAYGIFKTNCNGIPPSKIRPPWDLVLINFMVVPQRHLNCEDALSHAISQWCMLSQGAGIMTVALAF